jgi:cytochrome c oxidase subunit 4
MNQAQPQSVEEHKHPNEGVYFVVFLLLAILTLTELMVTYIPIVKVPLLLALAITKAWLVVAFFMHLRYDNRIFSYAMLIPVIVGTILTIILQPLATIVR